jgi:type IV secretion system protein VirB1
MIDFPALVQQCAPSIGPTTMMAIIRTESGGYPWALNDNTIRLSRQPASKEEAVTLAKELIKQGHSVDIGLGQVNSQHLGALGITVDQIIEPCANLRAAAGILSDAYSRASRVHGQGQKALLSALSAYNTGSLERGFGNGYVQKVVNSAGLTIAAAVPSLRTGAVYTGRKGTAKVQPNGQITITPYNAPLVVHDFTLSQN